MEHKSQDWHRADIKSALKKKESRSEIFLVRLDYHPIHCAMYLHEAGPERNSSLRRRSKPRQT